MCTLYPVYYNLNSVVTRYYYIYTYSYLGLCKHAQLLFFPQMFPAAITIIERQRRWAIFQHIKITVAANFFFCFFF